MRTVNLSGEKIIELELAGRRPLRRAEEIWGCVYRRHEVCWCQTARWRGPDRERWVEQLKGEVVKCFLCRLRRRLCMRCFFPSVFCSSLLWHSPSPAFPRLWREPTWRAPSPRLRDVLTSPAPTSDSLTAALRWVMAPANIHVIHFQHSVIVKLLGFSLTTKIFQFRQLAVSGCGQSFWSQTAPPEAHCHRVLPHGCWGNPHWTHTLLHGTVHHSQILLFK